MGKFVGMNDGWGPIMVINSCFMLVPHLSPIGKFI